MLDLLQGFQYAGLQNSQECHCSDEYDRHGEVDNCTNLCPGNSSETCGGASAIQIYSLGKICVYMYITKF